MTGPIRGLLGPGAVYEGDVALEGHACIEGHLKGTVTSDDLIEVTVTGRVEGTAEAPQILVAGTVDGVLIASERITVLETARVSGRIEAPWLDVRNGARLEGRISVWRDDPAEAV